MSGIVGQEAPALVQRCVRCRKDYPADNIRPNCECGGLLDVEQPQPELRNGELRSLFEGRRHVDHGPFASGVWRFGELILAGAVERAVTQPEGNTPLLNRPTVSAFAGIENLLLKHEGHNPTGSFKDRGMTVAVTQARRVGATALACATTGNTGASLAAYGALAGLRALILVPRDGIATGKLAQVLAYGGRVVLVRGDFDACLRLVREAVDELGVYLVNSINPFRLEGQKTIVLELLQQLQWQAPDWIVFPAGNLGNAAAFGKALREARAWGLIDRMPRLAAVQAEGAAPFARSFRDGFRTRHQVVAQTVASAIRIGNPASYDRAVTAIRETDGVVTTATDPEILDAKAVVDAAGVGCEPASAASIAGVRRLAREGIISKGERVVAVLTGHLLKDPTLVTWYHAEAEPRPAYANRPAEIEPTMTDLARIAR
ncbi:MAG: threonine synthase [Gemmatimonadetes bacterium]|nr:threonine synthase [Gemmatimonadota bacterium]